MKNRDGIVDARCQSGHVSKHAAKRGSEDSQIPIGVGEGLVEHPLTSTRGHLERIKFRLDIDCQWNYVPSYTHDDLIGSWCLPSYP